jgi:hypothetical protein
MSGSLKPPGPAYAALSLFDNARAMIVSQAVVMSAWMLSEVGDMFSVKVDGTVASRDKLATYVWYASSWQAQLCLFHRGRGCCNTWADLRREGRHFWPWEAVAVKRQGREYDAALLFLWPDATRRTCFVQGIPHGGIRRRLRPAVIMLDIILMMTMWWT